MIMASHLVLIQQIGADGFDAECPNPLDIISHRFGALCLVPLADRRRECPGVEDYQVEELAPGVFVQGPHVV